MTCPVCGCERLFGPAKILIVTTSAEDRETVEETWEYMDCARCHHLLLVVDGELVAKAGAW